MADKVSIFRLGCIILLVRRSIIGNFSGMSVAVGEGCINV